MTKKMGGHLLESGTKLVAYDKNGEVLFEKEITRPTKLFFGNEIPFKSVIKEKRGSKPSSVDVPTFMKERKKKSGDFVIAQKQSDGSFIARVIKFFS